MAFFNDDQLAHLDDSDLNDLATSERLSAQDRLIERFENRFGEKKNWFLKNKPNRQRAFHFSFLFNLISAMAGYYGGKVIMEVIPIPYLPWIMAAIGLILMERYKRIFSDKMWDYFWKYRKLEWGAFTANVTLFTISLAISAFGMFFLIDDNSTEAKLMGSADDPEAQIIIAEIQDKREMIKAKRADKSNYNSQGQFFWPLQQQEAVIEQEIATKEEILREKHGVYAVKNEDLLKKWALRTGFRSYTSVIITILSEILFELCMCFVSYYDWRVYAAMKRKRDRQRSHTHNGSYPEKKSPAFT